MRSFFSRNMKITSSVIVVSFTLTTLLLFFQNCSPTPVISTDDGASQVVPNFSFFHYQYSKKPNLYANLALIFPSQKEGTFERFQIYGMLTPSDGSYGYISYSVSVTDENNTSICVGESGVLDPDKTNIIFECLASPQIQKARVKLVATYKDIEETFISSFSK